ncbi:MAG: L-glyceraldehyde 3-phosphate reductase [Candidatus Limiplasma sp.]|nr:L-glyceraldehyde 3-phosphate reductase [Candidatus Limiplasma sp.]
MHQPQADRYQRMEYQRCGKSGLKLPMVSLGLWHNFGAITPFDIQQSLLRTAFDCGITHFDLANNYGPPYGEAERNFGLHMDRDWKPYRDELVISTKAGWDMWPGPYGNWGSRKYLMASLDQSLKRMHLDYVDIFYHHRFDPETPLEETMGALYDIVKSGKALYVGISSSYGPEETARASAILKEMGMHLLIHQPRYSMLARQPEDGLLDTLEQEGMGCIAFSPLRNGILTDRYLHGIPADSRAAHDPRYLKPELLTEELLDRVRHLNDIAQRRGQSLAQMALSWVLRKPQVTSVLIGASKPEQIVENCQIVSAPPFTKEELDQIDALTAEK